MLGLGYPLLIFGLPTSVVIGLLVVLALWLWQSVRIVQAKNEIKKQYAVKYTVIYGGIAALFVGGLMTVFGRGLFVGIWYSIGSFILASPIAYLFGIHEYKKQERWHDRVDSQTGQEVSGESVVDRDRKTQKKSQTTGGSISQASRAGTVKNELKEGRDHQNDIRNKSVGEHPNGVRITIDYIRNTLDEAEKLLGQDPERALDRIEEASESLSVFEREATGDEADGINELKERCGSLREKAETAATAEDGSQRSPVSRGDSEPESDEQSSSEPTAPGKNTGVSEMQEDERESNEWAAGDFEVEIHKTIRRLRSDDASERKEATENIRRLTEVNSEELEGHEDGLLRALETEDERVKRAAAVALGEVGSVRCVNKLSELNIPESEEAVDRIRKRKAE